MGNTFSLRPKPNQMHMMSSALNSMEMGRNEGSAWYENMLTEARL